MSTGSMLKKSGATSNEVRKARNNSAPGKMERRKRRGGAKFDASKLKGALQKEQEKEEEQVKEDSPKPKRT